MIKYAIVEHYPNGDNSTIAMFPTEKEAKNYIATNHYDLCTIEQVKTIKLGEELK